MKGNFTQPGMLMLDQVNKVTDLARNKEAG